MLDKTTQIECNNINDYRKQIYYRRLNYDNKQQYDAHGSIRI